MKDLTLKELFDNYGKLENIEAKIAKLNDSFIIPEAIKKTISAVEHEPNWDKEKDRLSLERTLDMNIDPNNPRRYYFVSVWKDINHKERIGVIVFGQSQTPNKPGYMVEHLSMVDPAFNFLSKSHYMVDTLDFRSESEGKALIKIAGEIMKQEVTIKSIKFDDTAPGFKRCDKC